MSDLGSLDIMPIPHLRSPSGWKDVSIEECGEPLVQLSAYPNLRIFADPKYFRRGVPTAIETIYMREGALQRLTQAASFLPKDYSLVIWDAWRPVTVQQALFDEEFERVRDQHPDLSESQATKRTETYVSLPSTEKACPSPHYTGGAIDLGLADRDGQALFAGTVFDAFDERARTTSLEERLNGHVSLSQAEIDGLRHRRILYHAMTHAGFTNYCEEWWHFDYGNQFWASVVSKHAIYGAIIP